MSKINFKALIKKIRQTLKITGFEKKLFYRNMDNVITFLRSSPIDESHAKVYSSFLSSIMHLFKNIAQENKTIDEDDEGNYTEKFCIILSYFIDSEVKRLKVNVKDSTKTNPEKMFLDNLIVKCRIYNANAGDMMIVGALGKFLARIDFHHVFADDLTKLTFSRLFKKILISRTNNEVKQKDTPYHHQILHTWLKICNIDDTKLKEKILKIASDLNIIIESVENGRIDSIRQNILGMEIQPEIINYALDKSVDLFDNHTDDSYSIKNINWLKKLEKTQFSADDTVDLTIDTDDSDIEVELPAPVELIEVDDNEHEIPPLTMSTSILKAIDRSPAISQTPKIGIQERRDYIRPISDNIKPLSFMALRRLSILQDERKKLITTPASKRRKSAHGRLFEEVSRKRGRTKPTDGKRASGRTRSKSVNHRNIVKSPPDAKKLSNISKTMRKCSVYIHKITNREIAQFRRGKLTLEYFESKFGANKNVRRQSVAQNAKRKLTPGEDKKKEPSPKKRKLTKKSRKNNNNSSYPDHTQPNISLLQVIVNDLSLQPTSSTHKNETITDISFESTQPSASKSEDEASVPIVNWPRDQPYSPPLIDSSPNVQANSLDTVSTSNLVNNGTENFDAISDSEHNGSIESAVNMSLLEDILGDRANNYIPEVHASIQSTLSRSSQSADESSLSTTVSLKTSRKSNERRKSGRRKHKKVK